MNRIDFIAGGMMGDFIHCMSVVKCMCERDGAKACIYLTDDTKYGGDVWRYGAAKAHADVGEFVMAQDYVESFEILTNQPIGNHCNLNGWRSYIMQMYMKEGAFTRCWSDFLSETYGLRLALEYRWMDIPKDNSFFDKTIIHRSIHRHNPRFPWRDIVDSIAGDIIFLTTNQEEFNRFHFKGQKVKLHLVSTVSEMATAIASCKYFIGNQSSPAAIASALDVPRLIELGAAEARFYSGESGYSKNVSWFLNRNDKFISENSLIKI